MVEEDEPEQQVILLHEAMGLTQERADELQLEIFNAYVAVLDENFCFNRAELLKRLAPAAANPYEAAIMGYMACLDEVVIVNHIKTDRYLKMVTDRKGAVKGSSPPEPHGYG